MIEAVISFLVSVLPLRVLRSISRLSSETFFQAVHSCNHNAFPWASEKMTFTISFDCDSPEDAGALAPVVRALKKHGITSSFAVCGNLVEKDPDSYSQIIREGHEIFNHGYSRHVDDNSSGLFKPALFYSNLPRERIRNEIHWNHACLKKVLGVEMAGFRTPHFGCFQGREDFSFLYSVLKELGYLYSTSSFAHIYQRLQLWENPFGIREFPLSGYTAKPFSVFDTWSFRRKGRAVLMTEFKKTLEFCLRSPHPIWLNIYLDPSQIMAFGCLESMLCLLNRYRDQIKMINYIEASKFLTKEMG